MKGKFILLIYSVILAFISLGCATMLGKKADPSMRSYEKKYELPGQTKDQLYIKVNGWFVETFNSAESVIEFQDKEAGKLMGKYVYGYLEGVYAHRVKQVVDISIKDEKIRFKVTNPSYKTTSGMGETYHNATYSPLETVKGLQKARQKWKKLSYSLNAYLQKDDDW